MSRRILHVVTNVGHYADSTVPTGLWLSELTHAHDIFAAAGYAQQIVSPKGGPAPLEPRSLKWPNADGSAKRWLADAINRSLLLHTVSPATFNAQAFDAIYFTGGHAVMYDFPDCEGLQKLARDIYENGGVVASVCHGYCGLFNTRLSDGALLVAGRRVTGFSWREEILAGVAKMLPYNSEEQIKQRGARYEKALLPFIPNVVVDGRLITGQNPQSAKLTAKRVVELLQAKLT